VLDKSVLPVGAQMYDSIRLSEDGDVSVVGRENDLPVGTAIAERVDKRLCDELIVKVILWLVYNDNAIPMLHDDR
jgi:hypothetical protein